MFKKILLLIILTLSLVFSNTCLADEYTKVQIENIIEGNQDVLVFANIIEKGTSSYEVQILEEVGAADGEGKLLKDSDEAQEIKINVTDFTGYMYYDDHNYRPQKGDNVLLSLVQSGNGYVVKNGAYRVDSASRDQFNFMVPEGLNASDEALELSALYIYVKSNGETNKLSIKDGAIYGKDANGEDEKLDIPGRLKFIDDVGDVTEKPSVAELYGSNEETIHESKWYIALIILLFGMVSGVFIVKLINKFDGRYDG